MTGQGTAKSGWFLVSTAEGFLLDQSRSQEMIRFNLQDATEYTCQISSCPAEYSKVRLVLVIHSRMFSGAREDFLPRNDEVQSSCDTHPGKVIDHVAPSFNSERAASAGFLIAI